jgi:hypothetical protein
VSDPGGRASESEVKAAFLFNFVKFVEWPGEGGGASVGPIVVGVLGRGPLGDALRGTLDGRDVGNRTLAVRRVSTDAEIAGCHVVFVAAREREEVAELAVRAAGPGRLTVGDGTGFLESGGIILLTLENARVRFVVNADAARRAGLEVSSKLLALATVVHDRDLPGGG